MKNVLISLKAKKNSKKGFTLMEMLIVVAIIAVLVAIAIPTFSGALTKAKEAADEANVRAAYAEVVLANMTDNVAFPADETAFIAEIDATLNYSSKLDYTLTAASGTTPAKITVTYNADKIDDLSLTANAYSVS